MHRIWFLLMTRVKSECWGTAPWRHPLRHISSQKAEWQLGNSAFSGSVVRSTRAAIAAVGQSAAYLSLSFRRSQEGAMASPRHQARDAPPVVRSAHRRGHRLAGRLARPLQDRWERRPPGLLDRAMALNRALVPRAMRCPLSMPPYGSRARARRSRPAMLALPLVVGRLQLPDDRIDRFPEDAELRIPPVMGQIPNKRARLRSLPVRGDDDVPALRVVMEIAFPAACGHAWLHGYLQSRRGA
jgi:hypothetical protein